MAQRKDSSRRPGKQPKGLRRAHPGDATALVALESACFNSDRIAPRQWRYQLGSPSIEIWVAPAGRSKPVELRAALVLFFRRDSRVARVYSLAVAPRYRGEGLGEALLSRAATRARQRGCTTLALEVREDNDRALALYLRSGFSVRRKLPDYYADGTEGLRLEKAL